MAPDYTNAFLVSALALSFVILMIIWAVWGFITALGLSYVTDRVIVSRRRDDD